MLICPGSYAFEFGLTSASYAIFLVVTGQVLNRAEISQSYRKGLGQFHLPRRIISVSPRVMAEVVGDSPISNT